MERCEEFFRVNSPPDGLQSVSDRIVKFVQEHRKAGRRIALVASGGTTVPVERNTVRFLDNFSSGQRGSASAEYPSYMYFLAKGYAVIFLHRGSSMKPFQRHCVTDNPLDWLAVREDKVQVSPAASEVLTTKLSKVLLQYAQVKQNGCLHLVPFTSVFEYFYYLREVATMLKSLGNQALFYLAAAVSDFYIKPSDMPQHKVSSSSDFSLKFSHTPKMLLMLTSEWAPNAFTVTFKLETDESLLIPHAKAALEKYHHQIVVANLLESRRTMVTLVSQCPGDSECRIQKVLNTDSSSNGELEELIVTELVQRHTVLLDSVP